MADEFERKSITGADLTGSDGDSGRTYTILDTNFDEDSVQIIINGRILMSGASRDFTIASTIVTFTGPVFDVEVIEISYYITTETGVSNLIRADGADFTGASGDTNRQYTIPNANYIESTVRVTVNGRILMNGATRDFTLTGTTLEILGILYDSDLVEIFYFLDTVDSESEVPDTCPFGNTLEIIQFCMIEGTVPDRSGTGQSRVNETVGTIENNNLYYYLDHAYVYATSYTIYVGTNVETATALTETDDYSIDKDNGKITLTSDAYNANEGANLYAKYSYCTVNIPDSEMTKVMNRACAQVQEVVKRTYPTDVDGETPGYTKVTEELHDWKNNTNRSYYAELFPIVNLNTVTTQDIAVDASTVQVSSTTGFPESGIISAGTNKITYTSKTTTSFSGCSGVETTISEGDGVYGYCVEASTTAEGAEPTYQVQEKDVNYSINFDSGRIYLQRLRLYTDEVYNNNVLMGTPDRVRISYVHGETTIPEDIKQLFFMFCAKDILHKAVRFAHASGRNNFEPSMIEVDEEWMKAIIREHRLEFSDEI